MQVAVFCSQAQREELGPVPDNVIFTENIGALCATGADVLIDLQFEDHQEQHLPLLQGLPEPAVLVCLVNGTTENLPANFCRINAWPTFLAGAIAEVAGGEAAQQAVARGLALLGKTPEWTPDVPGMVSARVIASIVNEAYFAFSEGIATREAIDTAMKLGTAYPYGPFEWAGKIGLARVAGLLRLLSRSERRYQPCAFLEQEAVLAAVDGPK